MRNHRATATDLTVLPVLLFLLVSAEGQSQEYVFETNDNLITISRYVGSAEAVVIPDKINGLSIDSIDGAFYHCTNVTRVILPNGVTSIGEQSFQYCEHLTTITIPNSVTNIGAFAFSDCGMTNITLSTSLTSIEKLVFAECINLTSI